MTFSKIPDEKSLLKTLFQKERQATSNLRRSQEMHRASGFVCAAYADVRGRSPSYHGPTSEKTFTSRRANSQPAQVSLLRLRASPRPSLARASHFYVRGARARPVRVVICSAVAFADIRSHVGALALPFYRHREPTILVNVFVEGRRECRLFVEGAKCASTHGVLEVRTRSSARWMDESSGDQASWCSPDVSLWINRYRFLIYL
jgi:hypothetical protein